MGKAHVDPAELRRFAAYLKRFNNDQEALLGGLRNGLSSLEASWRDQQQKKFSDAFESTVKVLQGFLNDSREHQVFLNKQAAVIEAYLKSR